LVDGRIVERFDCFRGTSALEKLSKDLRPQGVNFFALKAEKSRLSIIALEDKFA
jgi:hypothetical protein